MNKGLMSTIETAGGLFPGIETTATNEAGNNARLDSHNPAVRVAGEDEMIRQPIEGMDGRWTTIRPA